MTSWKCSECGCPNGPTRDACQACFTTPPRSVILASAYGLEIPKVIVDIILATSWGIEHTLKFQALIVPKINEIDYVTYPCSFHRSLHSRSEIHHMDLQLTCYLEEASHVIEGGNASMSTMARRPQRIIVRLSDISYCLFKEFP
jgi:hypothetical protein